jgi:hypothetical protein
LVAALKGGSSKNARFQPAKPGNFDGTRDWRLWMFGLWKWKTTSMPPKFGDTRPWSLPNATWKATWRIPKFLVRPKRGLSYLNNRIVRNLALPALSTKGGRGACWSSGIGLGRMTNFSYLLEPASN